MEQLIPLKTAISGKKYDVYRLIEDENGLRIFLCGSDLNDKIQICFPAEVCMYRNIDESYAIPITEKLYKEYGHDYIANDTLFEVQNSVFAKEVEKGSYGTIKADALFHLRIISVNFYIDVVTFKAPDICRVDNVPNS